MADDLTISLTDLMSAAFMAGFGASCEGYNAEYPFNDCEHNISRELSEKACEAIERILSEVVVGERDRG